MTMVDPLAELRPLHLPAPVSWWPPAPGWWVLTIVLLLLVSLLGRRALRARRATAFRRQALCELDRILAAQPEPVATPADIAALNQLLRRVALSSRAGRKAAALQGEDWLTFLDESMAAPTFNTPDGRALIDFAYRPEGSFDWQALTRHARSWIGRQR